MPLVLCQGVNCNARTVDVNTFSIALKIGSLLDKFGALHKFDVLQTFQKKENVFQSSMVLFNVVLHALTIT